MIELHITMTGKSYSPRSEWQTFAHDRKAFDNREAAEAWIDENYGKSKRTKMYMERKGEPDFVCGYVIGFRSGDWSHAPVEKWLQQDWIEFREVKTLKLAEA